MFAACLKDIYYKGSSSPVKEEDIPKVLFLAHYDAKCTRPCFGVIFLFERLQVLKLQHFKRIFVVSGILCWEIILIVINAKELNVFRLISMRCK